MLIAIALITLMVLTTVCAIAICVQSGRDSRAEEIAEALERALSRELSDTGFQGAAE